MTLTQLKYFKTVGEINHIGLAARQLRVSQPSLSKMIHQLEEELGVALFERQGRNIQLSEAGKIYYYYISKSMEYLEKANREMELIREGYEGEIRLGFSYNLGEQFIPCCVSGFLQEESENKVKFILKQANSMELIELLKKDLLDVAVCCYQGDEEEIAVEKVMERKITAIVPEEYVSQTEGQITLKELERVPFISYSVESGFHHLLNQFFEEKNFHPQIAYEVNEDSAVAGLVERGLGAAIAPDIVIFDGFHVKKLEIADWSYKEQINMVYVREKHMEKLIRRFIGYIRRGVMPRADFPENMRVNPCPSIENSGSTL